MGEDELKFNVFILIPSLFLWAGIGLMVWKEEILGNYDAMYVFGVLSIIPIIPMFCCFGSQILIFLCFLL